MKRPIRVLVVDDSDALREILAQAIRQDAGLELCAQARNGEEAVAAVMQCAPDVISMDLMMPRLGGLEAIRRIMAVRPTPIVVVSTLSDSQASLDAIQAGALEVSPKPQAVNTPAGRQGLETILKSLRLMSGVRVIGRPIRATPPSESARPCPRPLPRFRCLCIASSTGGPPALRRILQELPADYSVPIVVVQHIPEGFGKGLVAWLDGLLSLRVQTARAGDFPQSGTVHLAPDSQHLEIDSRGRFLLTDHPPICALRPAADRLFATAAAYYRSGLLGMVLTGMGRDGAEGAAEIKRWGGLVVGQDEQSSVVYGMPKAVADLGLCDQVLSLDALADLLAASG